MRTGIKRISGKRGAFALSPLEKLEAIFNKVVTSEKGCDEWQGMVRGHMGYSSVKWRNKTWFGHRLVYTLIYGEIPEGMCVMHTCDNPKCLNPEHLKLGTNQDNIDDEISKGRDYNQRKAHCLRGHPFSGTNLVLRREGKKRSCRKCESIRAVISNRKSRARKKQGMVDVN